MWKVSHCRACGSLIEWRDRQAYNFEGLGKTGVLHISTCTNPHYFEKSKPKEIKTKARERLLKDPWWNK